MTIKAGGLRPDELAVVRCFSLLPANELQRNKQPATNNR